MPIVVAFIINNKKIMYSTAVKSDIRSGCSRAKAIDVCNKLLFWFVIR